LFNLKVILKKSKRIPLGPGKGILDKWHEQRLRWKFRVVLEKQETGDERSEVENRTPES